MQARWAKPGARVAALLVVLLACLVGAAQDAAQPDAAPPPPAQIAVSPARVELTLGAAPTTESIRIFNLGGEPTEVKVRLAPWTLDEANQVQVVEPDEQSLDQWMVVNPLRFTVAPGGYQTVRFSVRPRVRPTPGEHRAMIFFEQVPPQDPTAQLRVAFTFGVAVYAYAGEITRAGVVEGIEAAADGASLRAGITIASEGNAHIRLLGQYAVWPADRFPGTAATGELPGLDQEGFAPAAPMLAAGFLPTTPVLPGTRRVVPLAVALALPTGSYVLDLNGTLGDQAVDRAIPFVVPEPAPTATTLPALTPTPESAGPPPDPQD